MIDLGTVDSESPAGTRTLLAAAMRQLCTLPTDVRIANALCQLATAQRAIIEGADFVSWIEALEGARWSGGGGRVIR